MPCPVTSLIFTFSLMLVATYWLSKHVSTVRGNFFPSFSWAFQKVDQYSPSGFLKTPNCLWFFFPKYLVWSWPSFELHLLRNGSVLPLWHPSLPPPVVLLCWWSAGRPGCEMKVAWAAVGHTVPAPFPAATTTLQVPSLVGRVTAGLSTSHPPQLRAPRQSKCSTSMKVLGGDRQPNLSSIQPSFTNTL